MSFRWKPYVPVARRRQAAEREMAKLRQQGHPVCPLAIEGRDIARTFWGRAWCDNLERYSDFANRLPRGRTYVRNGSVVDLQIEPGVVHARVSGSELYRVRIEIAAMPPRLWSALCADCAGTIDSLVELLQGRFSKGVMERLCRQETGLFPAPREIKLDCSCPDWAAMCKHVAAVLYGVGARLDEQPELLFRLRRVAPQDLLARASGGAALARPTASSARVLDADDLGALFGLELGRDGDEAPVAPAGAARAVPAPARGRAKPPPAPAPTRAAKPTGAAKPPPRTPTRAAKPTGAAQPPPRTPTRAAKPTGAAQPPAPPAPKRAAKPPPPRTPTRAAKPTGTAQPPPCPPTRAAKPTGAAQPPSPRPETGTPPFEPPRRPAKGRGRSR